MQENRLKYQQSFHTPLMQPPLITDFGLLGTGLSSSDILHGKYNPPNNISQHINNYLYHPAYLQKCLNTENNMTFSSLEEYS
jgi:hypothetical protein